MTHRIVWGLAGVQFLFLTYFTTQISISGQEANLFFAHSNITGAISYYTCQIFGTNDLTARLPFLLLHFASTIMLFELSKTVLLRNTDRIIAVMFYAFLPGVNIAALLINKAMIIIFLTLLFLLLMQKGFVRLMYLLLCLYAFTDNAFSILFLALIFYGVKLDDKKLIVINIILFGINMFLFGFDNGGKPKSMFLDTLGVYFAIFSPFVFIYFLFSIYKSFRAGSNQSVLYISFWALLFSLILSIRQKVQFEDFAPFVVLSVLFMVSTFFASYRVRLRPFRKGYKLLGYSLSATMLLTLIAIFCSKQLYPMLSNPAKHFAYNYHVAKELSIELKKLGITNITCRDKDTQLRLKFYGIDPGKEFVLSKKTQEGAKRVSIIYTGTEIATYYVTKVNTL